MSEEQHCHLLSFPGPLLVQGRKWQVLIMLKFPLENLGLQQDVELAFFPSNQGACGQSIYSTPLLPGE